jgi:hypothetical protein
MPSVASSRPYGIYSDGSGRIGWDLVGLIRCARKIDGLYFAVTIFYLQQTCTDVTLDQTFVILV